MFEFLKKRKTASTQALDTSEEERRKQENGASSIGAGYAATQTAQAATQKAAKTYAKPTKYSKDVRKLYDDGKAKARIKQRDFNNNSVVKDPYTGMKLELKHNDAKIKYGEDWAWHAAEADHKTPIENVFNDNKNNPWISNSDLKEIINSDKNLETVSKKFNATKKENTNKGLLSNEETAKKLNISDEKAKNAVKRGEDSRKAILRESRNTSVKNALKTGHEAGKYGAKSAGVTTLTMSGIMNAVAVIKGEKDSGQAIADTLKDGGKAAITGYTMSGGLTVASHSLSNSSSKFIQGLVKSNVPGKVITAVIVTGDTLKKWGDGEITTQECLIELGDKGLNMATMGYSMAVGQTLIPIPIVGSAVGALVGSMLTSTYYNNLINTLQTKELEHQERQKIIAESHAAAEQARAFREELESYLESYFKDYKDCFDEALSSMRFAFQVGDADGIIAGANKITRKLGGQVQYESVEEFKNFLDSDSVDVL